MLRIFYKNRWVRRVFKIIVVVVSAVTFAFSAWLGWNLFYFFIFPVGCILTEKDPRMICYRYSVSGTKYDGNFIDDFRRRFSLHPGYAIEIEFPMIYYYGEEGFVVLNQESPEIKILKAENPNYSSYWWESKKHRYVKDVIICEKISDLTPKEQQMYYKLKNSPMMLFPYMECPGMYDFKTMYKNMQIPRPYEEEEKKK